MKIYRTSSSAETKALAAQLVEELLGAPSRPRRTSGEAKIITLYGDLGAGKTTFVQGFLRALQIRGRITSPTFVLMKRFAIPAATKRRHAGRFKNAYHIDAYRLRTAADAASLGLRAIFADSAAIVLVEWPERLAEILPRRTLPIRFKHGKTEGERDIII